MILRRALQSLVFFLLAATLACVWLMATDRGLRVGLQLAQRVVPGELRWQAVSGRLLGHWRLEGLSWQRGGTALEVGLVEAELAADRLWHSELVWRRLKVHGVRVELPPPEPDRASNPPPQWVWEALLGIRALDVQAVAVARGSEPDIRIDGLSWRLARDSGSATLQALSLQAAGLTLRASGTVSRVDGLGLELGWHLSAAPLPVDAWSDQPLEARGSLKGDLYQVLDVAAQVRTPFVARVRARVERPLADAQVEAQVELAPTPLPVDAGADWRLGARIDLVAALSVPSVTAQIDGRIEGPVALAYRTRMNWDAQELRLAEGQIRVLPPPDPASGLPPGWPVAGSATFNARSDWPVGTQSEWDAQVRWRDLAGASDGGWGQSPEGKLHLSGTPAAWQLGLLGDWQAPDASRWVVSAKAASESGGPRPGINWSLAATPEGGGGRLEAAGHLQPRQQLVDAQVVATGVQVPPHWSAGQRVDLDGTLQVSGRWSEAASRIEVATDRLRINLNGEPVRATAQASMEGGAVRISRLELAAETDTSSVQLRGQIRRDGLDLKLSATIAQVQRWIPAGSGSVQVDARLYGEPNAPALEAQLQARNLQSSGVRAASVAVELGGRWPEALQLKLAAADIEVEEQANASWKEMTLTMDGGLASHRMQFAALGAGSAPSLVLVLHGRRTDGGWDGVVDSARVDLPPPASQWTLTAPFALGFAGDQIQIDQHCWLGRGERDLCMEGSGDWRERLTLEARFRGFELAALNPLLAGRARAEGAVDGRVHLEFGLPGVHHVEAKIDASGARLLWWPAGSSEEQVLLQFDRLHLNAQSDSQAVRLVATAIETSGARLDADLSVRPGRLETHGAWAWSNWPQARLNGSVSGQLRDLGVLAWWLPRVTDVAGVASASLAVSGSLSDPRLAGQVALEGGRFTVPKAAITVDEVAFSLDLSADGSLSVSGSAHSGGTLVWTGSGRYGATPQLELAVKGVQVRLSDTPRMRLEASPDLQVQVVPGTVYVRGEVGIPAARIEPRPVSFPVSAHPDVEVVGAQETEPTKRWRLDTDLWVQLSDRVVFKGYGFDGRLSGRLHVREPAEGSASATGELRVPEGLYEAYGRQLRIENGRLIYARSPLDNPALDILATRTLNELVVGVRVRGTAQQPEVTLYASEAMAQTDILSYLVLGQPMSTLGQGEANALVTAAQSAVLVGGDLLAELIGREFGLDVVRIEHDTGTQSPWLVVGTYLSPRLYLSYEVGLFAPGSRVHMEYRLSRRWSLEAEGGVSSAVDLLYTLD